MEIQYSNDFILLIHTYFITSLCLHKDKDKATNTIKNTRYKYKYKYNFRSSWTQKLKDNYFYII